MNETLIVYLYGIWGNIGGALETVLVIMVMGAIAGGLILLITSNELGGDFIKKFKKILYIKTFIFVFVLNTLMPSKEIFVAMIAATPVVNTVKELGSSEKVSKIEKILDLSLDKAVRELEKNNE